MSYIEELLEIKEEEQWNEADLYFAPDYKRYDPYKGLKYRFFAFSGRASDLVEALKRV